MANRFKPLPYTIEREILSALLPGYADKLDAHDKKSSREAPERPDSGLGAVPELLGDWSGTVHTYEDDLPLTLSFKPSGDIHAQLGTQLTTLVNDAEFEEGRLTGKIPGGVLLRLTEPFGKFRLLQLQ